MSVTLDIKQDLRDRIQGLINLGPIVSLNIFSAQDMRGIDRFELSNLMDMMVSEYQKKGYNLTYDITEGCRVTLCNSQLNYNSPGGQCAIDFSMRRFKRSSYHAISSYITVTPTSPAVDMF